MGPDVADPQVSDLPFDDVLTGLPEPEEYDDAPTRDEVAGVRTESRLTREERALQQAIPLGMDYGWHYDDIQLLAEVFRLHWWTSAKKSMVRELEAGMTPEELKLALITRQVWRERQEFHENLGFGRFAYPHQVLPWPTALAVAREYEFEPDPDEVDATLQDLYDQWRWSTSLTERFRSFYDFVRLQFGLQAQTLHGVPGWSFVPDADRRCIEEDTESLHQADLRFGSGCYRTLPSPMHD